MKNLWWSGALATMFFLIFGFVNALAGVLLPEIMMHVAPASIVFFLLCWLIFHMHDLKKEQHQNKTSDDLWKCPKCGNALVQVWKKHNDGKYVLTPRPGYTIEESTDSPSFENTCISEYESGTHGGQYIRCYQCGYTEDI